jgi:streptogramin lyase
MFRRAWFLSGLIAAFLTLGASAEAATEQTSFLPTASASRARAMTAGPDGNIWFVGVTPFPEIGESIGRITPSGQIAEFPMRERHVEVRTGPAIVAGPEGNLWFAEVGSSKLGRITPSGQITEFPLPEAGSRPSAIASGPDGGIWFTEETTDKLGRLHGTTVTEFPLSPNSGPAGIAAGPDGNLWFTEKWANKIGRITPSGSITEFPVPTPGGLPRSIVLGPDGNLWFTEEGPHQVGRITPVGEITEFPVPGQREGVPADTTGTEAIVSGPDGDLWFTSGTHIGSITPSGQTAEPVCMQTPCDLPFASLAVGSEGHLWFGAGDRLIGEGGGGTALLELNAPGIVGKFVPPLARVEIGAHARSVVGRHTDLRLSCRGAVAGERCAGVLRLVKRVRHSGPRKAQELVLAHRRYELLTGESRRLPLRLTRKAARMLPLRGLLSARATVTANGDAETSRAIVLHRRSR